MTVGAGIDANGVGRAGICSRTSIPRNKRVGFGVLAGVIELAFTGCVEESLAGWEEGRGEWRVRVRGMGVVVSVCAESLSSSLHRYLSIESSLYFPPSSALGRHCRNV